ncbi:endopeptidase La [Candidatus Falkowbacteria bacterium RIFOXYB2_FULL_38_15]|uniref:Lon protease n=1 Tax=Candidatus Falkowbacteria bacterium RIFOXYA2_FULL_38_12 TaxID=1797993 RepID=A0A1F5S438_9BACT|nr:MAG: endopeptidase La [Candidatus Falkowbacteria bacterium RIFOXYA2_FULL_38_12]OGF33617.1 MAG: endopeptidase La [Candidatus Falkowbacteria bacterium RIFOXYB2_FULL_38_15]OGF43848.1 MAG: endopeptidase La [Candidatus Falkowbacteria bacterium RIFOXYD2_FULL_39_16]
MEAENLKGTIDSQTKKDIAVIPLIDVVIFPHVAITLMIKREKSLRALDYSMQHNRVIFCVSQKEDKKSEVSRDDLYQVGVLAKVRETAKQPDGSVKIVVEGIARAKIEQFLKDDLFLKVKINLLPEPLLKKTEKLQAITYSLINQFKECIALGATVPFDVLLVILNITDPWELADLMTINLDFSVLEKQAILEATNIEEKLQKLSEAISRQLNVLKMAHKIQNETGKELGKMEKEMFLREQLKTIEKELGVIGGISEVEELRNKIEKAGMPEEVREKALKELGRLEKMPSFSPEISYIRTYLDCLISLPWQVKSEDKVDIKKAKNILDEDHYGLEKVKERVLEYLAVQKLVGKIKGPILCFVGPPGTGKTSIGKSIAKSLGRKFFRMSLGGIHDEAEIRGHRRTYVGAMPGRIIEGINSVKTKNPVFMLDEIDKIGADFRGDPSSALLEALDLEQNNAFSDHYLEAPFDLSDTMFITTANNLDTIPPALRDRMEVIEFSGYIEEEKFKIAKNFLVSKQLKEHGLDSKKLFIEESAIRKIIREYTREAGVRELERNIAAICRKVARKIAENNDKENYKINASDISKYLGPEKYHATIAEKKNEVGVVTGLAWTEVGGEILLIEATKMPGKGQLILTGHLGKVMQESAKAAYTYVRSRAKALGVSDKFYKDSDIHIHVPAGATPKDGPSAGVAITTAIASVLTDRPVKINIGMTGEITLRGRVLEIGGVKGKVLAAHRAGVKTIILPKDNKKDLEEIPKNIRKDLKFIFVEKMDEVLKEVLTK